MHRGILLPACVALLGGCALRSDVDRLETQLVEFRAEAARQDSARARQLDAVLGTQRRILDTLDASRQALAAFKGDVSRDLYSVQQQLMQVQELTGQSQRRLSELRGQLDVRNEQLENDALAPAPDGGAPAGAPAAVGPPAAGGPTAGQMYEASLQQLRSGSTATARMGFRQMLSQYPRAAEAPDAVYFIGESFAGEAPDSAAAYYQLVATQYPQSRRAPAALYKLGLLAEQRRDLAAARSAYEQVATKYPNADEAALARDRLRALGQ